MADEGRTIHLHIEMSVPGITHEAAQQLTHELVAVLQHAVGMHMEHRRENQIEYIIKDIHINHEAYLAWQDAEGKSK